MNIIEIIDRKKNGFILTRQEIDYFVSGVSDMSLPDYQISALLMAICLRGMDDEETFYLTECMSKSGESINLSAVEGVIADKHSTGGVGDTTTFIVMPTVASLGIKMAKLSGRALGHTGGTIDKLEAISGFRTDLNAEEFINILNKNNLAIMSQSINLCPADKRLYAIRDVTATVDSIPLIASSIMSKKLVGGADVIALDVKCGSGAFMNDTVKAKELAQLMVAMGNSAGKRMRAVVSDMNQPLNRYIGNRLELIGAIEALNGTPSRLLDVSVTLSALIIEASFSISYDKAEAMVRDCILSGKAYNKFVEMIVNQGGDVNYLKNINQGLLPSYEVNAEESGYVSTIDTKMLGLVNNVLGGGRLNLEDIINHDTGLRLNVNIGDYVNVGSSLITVYCNKNEDLSKIIRNAFTLSDDAPLINPLIIDIIR